VPSQGSTSLPAMLPRYVLAELEMISADSTYSCMFKSLLGELWVVPFPVVRDAKMKLWSLRRLLSRVSCFPSSSEAIAWLG